MTGHPVGVKRYRVPLIGGRVQNMRRKQLGRLSQGEFITLMAVLISMVALSIDAMLPALPMIGADLGVSRANDQQYVISLFFLGFACGQLFYGPLSDSIGRKPSILFGLSVFALGCVLSHQSSDYEMMLLGRILQGIGAAAPRTVTVAIVRDLFSGRDMARIMSFTMAVFIIVPALAPSIGQGIMMIADWRAIFFSLLGLGLISGAWMMLRLPETLTPEKRAPLSIGYIGRAAWETLRTRAAFGYTIASGFIFGAFVAYLSTAPQVFGDVFGVVETFPLFFASLALSIGSASVVNARLVMRLGMRPLSAWALLALILLSGMAAAISGIWFDGRPPLWLFMVWGQIGFFCIGLLFANLNALAMEPVGHIAGTAAAVIGALSTALSLIYGIALGQVYNETVLPLILGFAVFGLLTMAAMIVTNGGTQGMLHADARPG